MKLVFQILVFALSFITGLLFPVKVMIIGFFIGPMYIIYYWVDLKAKLGIGGKTWVVKKKGNWCIGSKLTDLPHTILCKQCSATVSNPRGWKRERIDEDDTLYVEVFFAVICNCGTLNIGLQSYEGDVFSFEQNKKHHYSNSVIWTDEWREFFFVREGLWEWISFDEDDYRAFPCHHRDVTQQIYNQKFKFRFKTSYERTRVILEVHQCPLCNSMLFIKFD